MRPHGSPESLERRRRKAIQLLQQGLQPVDVARKLGVDRRSVRRWRASFEQEGPAGLQARPAPGRPTKLARRQKEQLERDLLKGAQAWGWSTDLWTCPRVADLIENRFGVRYHVDHIGRLLRRLGWTPQKPTRRARERDEEAIQGWDKKDWERLKKTPDA
jgi:transposase